MDKMSFIHYVLTKNPDDVRARIERNLGVKTDVRPSALYPDEPFHMVTFETTNGIVDLDFLRPDVLPPAVKTKVDVDFEEDVRG